MKNFTGLSRYAVAQFGVRLALLPLILSFGCSQSAASLARNAESEKSQIAQSDMPACGCCLIRDAPANLSHKAALFPERTNVDRVLIRGIIFESDGKTPAKNAVMYFYHTDETGHYTKRGDEPRNSFAWWHGKQRGWVKTNERGEYEINTVKPAPYPENRFAAHIHTTITTKNLKEDWIDNYLFEGDKLITARERQEAGRKGGFNPILTLEKDKNNIWSGVRNIQI